MLRAAARRLAPMSRFSEPQDPLFQALNSSIAFDFRLAPYDLEQSLAHARMLAHSGIIAADDLARSSAASRRCAPRSRRTASRSSRTTRTCTWRSSGGSPRSPATPGARLHTARSRNDQVATDVAMLVRAHSLDAQELLDG